MNNLSFGDLSQIPNMTVALPREEKPSFLASIPWGLVVPVGIVGLLIWQLRKV